MGMYSEHFLFKYKYKLCFVIVPGIGITCAFVINAYLWNTSGIAVKCFGEVEVT